jgi:hypothetical protein
VDDTYLKFKWLYFIFILCCILHLHNQKISLILPCEALAHKPSICPEGRLRLVETLHKGVDFYELPGSSPLCTIAVPSKNQCMKDVEFAECETAIVTESDHRVIYIFSTDIPEPIQILGQAGPRSFIQAIDVSNIKIVLLDMAH